MTSDVPADAPPRPTQSPAQPGWVLGAVLAAGAGRRFGGPKALSRDSDGVPWVHLATTAHLAGGLPRVVVVLGAEYDAARELLPHDPRITAVIAHDWGRGQSASLAAALRAAESTDASAILVTLVDLPGLPPSSVARLLETAVRAGLHRALAQATFDGRPGHPVVVGRDHWAALVASLGGDSGARDYVRAHDAEFVECGDLGDGTDVDTRDAVTPAPRRAPH
ncbi:NTP transferase domain-containing protein [Marisediminicola sp. LYQ85]|uniref:nucleotidyltransferase family protein n=1 Tax=Marisediminicola sp. LYQ85 TaxID=3391062 RepID=UPI0039830502